MPKKRMFIYATDERYPDRSVVTLHNISVNSIVSDLLLSFVFRFVLIARE